MYGIFTHYIYHEKNQPNVGKYTIPMEPYGFMGYGWCVKWLSTKLTSTADPKFLRFLISGNSTGSPNSAATLQN